MFQVLVDSESVVGAWRLGIWWVKFALEKRKQNTATLLSDAVLGFGSCDELRTDIMFIFSVINRPQIECQVE